MGRGNLWTCLWATSFKQFLPRKWVCPQLPLIERLNLLTPYLELPMSKTIVLEKPNYGCPQVCLQGCPYPWATPWLLPIYYRIRVSIMIYDARTRHKALQHQATQSKHCFTVSVQNNHFKKVLAWKSNVCLLAASSSIDYHMFRYCLIQGFVPLVVPFPIGLFLFRSHISVLHLFL